jgi:hypothetical protein
MTLKFGVADAKGPAIMNTLRLACFAALAASIAACGGGTGGTGVTSGTGGSNAVSIGVMQKANSVAVNGVNFAVSNAQITIDGSSKTPADLQNGMVVKIRGQINEDRVSGTAQQVQVENEVRGTVQTINTALQSFTVIEQTVFVDDLTTFANVSGLAGLTAGSSVVEVNGLRDASGYIRASRVEFIAGGTNIDELRGTISGLSGSTFTLMGRSVDATGAMITPSGTISDLKNGDQVEVHGTFNGTSFVAVRVDREDLEDAQFQPGANDDFQVEGFISGFTAHPGTFTINGQTVQTTSNTRFENGSAADLANNVEVEAEGHLTNGVLIADNIQFERTRVILTGAITTASGTTPGTITVLGEIVQITSLTQIDVSGGIALTKRVDVRGFVDSTGNIVAERIDDPSGGGKDSVQARVTAKNNNILTFEIGISADLTGATQLLGPNEQPVADLPTFLALITPASPNTPGTLVKVRGQFNTGTLTGEEAEIEN